MSAQQIVNIKNNTIARQKIRQIWRYNSIFTINPTSIGIDEPMLSDSNSFKAVLYDNQAEFDRKIASKTMTSIGFFTYVAVIHDFPSKQYLKQGWYPQTLKARRILLYWVGVHGIWARC